MFRRPELHHLSGDPAPEDPALAKLGASARDALKQLCLTLCSNCCQKPVTLHAPPRTLPPQDLTGRVHVRGEVSCMACGRRYALEVSEIPPSGTKPARTRLVRWEAL